MNDHDTGGGAETVPEVPQGRGHGKLGHYRLLRELGSGGMGTVYLAQQREPVRRQVAVKVIKPGLDTKMVLARFVAERQALARMTHPGIAQVYDASTTPEGRSYFVMEYVPGESLTDYCDHKRLDTAGRLALFCQVCRAIQHAHQKGVIHRDLKPSNILVCEVDGQPRPKVIDFGVAKAAAGELTTQTLFTEQGQLIGTPEYMSPEQADLTGLNVDTTSDIYSLGVILYELLTGMLPVDRQSLREAGVAGIQQMLRDVEPSKPSTRVTTIDIVRAEEGARRRRVEPRAWSRLLKGELDWITLKALAKEPERRYQSASEFAADLDRYKRGEAVLAGPPSHAYRLRKFVNVNRALVTGVAAVLLALTVGLTGVLLMYGVSEAARLEGDWRHYVASIRYANAAIDDHEADAAMRELSTCPEVHRNWEWEFLKARARKGQLLAAPEDKISAFTVSPSGNWVAYGTDSGDVRIIDVDGGGSRLVASAASSRITEMAVRPGGDHLAAFVQADSTISIWEVSSGDLILTRGVQCEWARQLTYTPDGRQLILVGPALTILDASDGATVRRIEAVRPENATQGRLRDTYDGIYFLADGSRAVIDRVAAGLGVGTLDSSETRLTIRPGFFSSSRTLGVDEHAERVVVYGGVNYGNKFGLGARDSLAPGSVTIADGWGGRVLAFFDLNTGEPVTVIDRVDGWIRDAAFARDGVSLVTGNTDSTVRIWNLRNGNVVEFLHGHDAEVTQVEVAGPVDRIFSRSEDNTIRYWGPIREVWQGIARPHRSSITRKIELSPDGNRLLVVQLDRSEVWDLRSGRLLALIEPPRRGKKFITAAFLDDETVISLSNRSLSFGPMANGRTRYFETDPDSAIVAIVEIDDPGTQLTVLGKPMCMSRAAAIDPQSGLVAVAADRFNYKRYEGSDRNGVQVDQPGSARCDTVPTVEIWDRHRARRVFSVISDDYEAYAVAFSPGGSMLAAGCSDGKVRIWDVARRTMTRELGDGSAPYMTVRFVRNGRTIVAGTMDSDISVWEINDGHRVAIVGGQGGAVNDVAMHPDGMRLFSASQDGAVRIWDVSTSDLLVTTEATQWGGAAFGVALSHDGCRLYLETARGISILAACR